MQLRQWLALAVAVIGLAGAGFVWTRDEPRAVAALPPPPAAAEAESDEAETPLAAPASDVTPADREARRFARYDKDKDGAVGRDEYLASRRKAFAKLDTNGDGRLGFEEYAAATTKKFGRADRDADGKLEAEEFAATAVKRRTSPACACKD